LAVLAGAEPITGIGQSEGWGPLQLQLTVFMVVILAMAIGAAAGCGPEIA